MNNPLKLMRHFARVSWPNIGTAAAGPAGPAPTALLRKGILYNSSKGMIQL